MRRKSNDQETICATAMCGASHVKATWDSVDLFGRLKKIKKKGQFLFEMFNCQSVCDSYEKHKFALFAFIRILTNS